MLESIQNDKFEYEKLSAEDQQKRGILGRLKGIIADFKNPTRNGRLYGQKVWESVFNDPITQEKIANRCMFGEMEHPTDGRTTIDPEKIAVCLAEVPKKDNKGHLIGVFDILNTPCGKILKTLLDYGTTVGISSRGQGDTFINSNGVEEVDPGSYDCTGWDIVLIPAVKEARMALVTESFGNKSLKRALAESIESSKEEDKKVMKETLDKLGISLTEEDKSSEKDVDIDATVESDKADDDGESLVEELQAALSQVQELQNKVGTLQEKLSVCYAKEFDYEEEIDKHKKTISKLTESVKSISPMRKRIDDLTEELDKNKVNIADSTAALEQANRRLKQFSSRCTSLREELNEKDETIKQLREEVETSKNDSSEIIENLKSDISSLKEQLITSKKEYDMKYKQYSDKLEKANKLVENYKKVAKTSVDKYIESQALKLGVRPSEIKSKLNESYTFNDIDKVCDEIQEFNYGLRSLPFDLNFNKNTKIKINESVDHRFPAPNEDDNVDRELLELAGIK
jgi:methyl-accepting chemotaxis protein